MRAIYLIRHGHPAVPPGPTRCISLSDYPLDELGLAERAHLKDWTVSHNVQAVFSSPALRCRQTAEGLWPGRDVVIRDDLREVAVGQWEGLSFDEIKREWPELYEERGRHLATVAPPGGECFVDAAKRLANALDDIMANTQGDVAIIGHGGIFRSWLCGALGVDPNELFTIRQPYGGISTVGFDRETYQPLSVGLRPNLYPDDLQLEGFFRICGTPEEVRAHGRAVAARAEELELPEGADRGLLGCACLVHDALRSEGRDHPRRLANLFRREGWPALADVVEQHHDLLPDANVEAQALYLADKLVRGTQPVTLEERFSASKQKCGTSEAMAAWERRYNDARSLAQRFYPAYMSVLVCSRSEQDEE